MTSIRLLHSPWLSLFLLHVDRLNRVEIGDKNLIVVQSLSAMYSREHISRAAAFYQLQNNELYLGVYPSCNFWNSEVSEPCNTVWWKCATCLPFTPASLPVVYLCNVQLIVNLPEPSHCLLCSAVWRGPGQLSGGQCLSITISGIS